MSNRRITALFIIAFGYGVEARAQTAIRAEIGGGIGWVLPSPEAVLIESSFFPASPIGPSRVVPRRAPFADIAVNLFADGVVYVAPRVGIMGQFSEVWSKPLIFMSTGLINHTRSRMYFGGMRVDIPCCDNKAVPFIYGLAGSVHSRARVENEAGVIEGPSDKTLGMAFGGGIETPGIVRIRVTGDAITASRHNKDLPNWSWRVNAGLALAFR